MPAEIPNGYCHCGCGQKTRIAPVTRSDLGWVRGQSIRFVAGHNARAATPNIPPPNPSGLCQCGCGRTTRIARCSRIEDGILIGQHLRYCQHHGPHRSATDRFWERVKKGSPNDCWEWQGMCLPETGYGVFTLGRQKVYAHRYSYQIANGEIPEGLLVLHKCDNPPCVNPAHLYAGTQFDNMRDARERGRLRQKAPQTVKQKAS